MNQLTTRATAVFAAMAAVLIITFAMAMNVSAQSNTPDWKQSPTGLTVSAGDEAGELEIIWDAHPQTSKTLSDYRVTWTPDGEDFKNNDQTDWYAYPTTNQVTVTGLDAGATYKVRVRTRYDDNKKSSWSDVVTGQAGAPTDITPTNNPATGQPTITGNARVRETLTATTSNIADDNGLTNASFTFQWIHSANDSEAYISGATASSYLLSSDDLGHSIKIRVSFTDDDGYKESLTSIATALVVMPPNVAATGRPTVTGTVELGEELTAETSTIADDNGLTNTVFSHQWVRSTNGADNNITDATGSTYVIASADVASAIKVQVSFTDDDGYSETLSSSATVSVPEPAQAPPKEEPRIARSSHNVLVTNSGETVNLTSASSAFLAQRFTTGPNASGYTIAEVGVFISNIGPTTTTVVSIRENDSSNTPGDLVATLTNPATFSNDALNMFTAPSNTTIDGVSTHYWITVNDGLTSNRGNFRGTTGDGQTGETGWSIGNARLWRSSESSAWNTDSVNLVISVRGSAGTSTASNDATLSDLELQDSSDDTTILSNPSFLPATTDYTTSVTRDVVEITIIPTLNDSNASYEIQDGTGTALTDADTNQDEFQVTLPLGETTVKIEVTAEDGNTTETYAVVVTRAHVELLSATLRVSVHASGNTGYQDGFFGSLSDRTFSFAGTSYTISHLYYGATPTRLILTADNSFTDTAKRLLVLKLDSTTFKFNDAVGSTNRQWTGPGLTWANAQRVRVIISGPELPNATTGLTATADSIDRINLRWHAPNDDGDSAIGGYRIEVSDDGGTTWTDHVSNTESGDTTYTHRFISPGTTNHYRVSAINGLGAGPASNVANATTDPGRQVWSATVTAGLISSSTTGTVTTETFGYSADDSVGSITDATFMIRGTEYTVELVSSYGLAVSGTPSTRWIYLDLDKALPTDITIAWYLAGRDYRLADAAAINETDHSYRFVGDKSDAALDWSTGDTISMTLTVSTADATLSALVVNDGTDDLSLDPTFDPATLGYSVEVAHNVDEVTITPTPNDTGASYEIQDDEGTALTDVDTTQDDFQVSISPGPNTINVVITGVDGHTTQTYTVTVQRINILVSNIDQTTAVATAVGNNGSTQIKHAQKFTTGSNTSGYTLYDVKVFLN